MKRKRFSGYDLPRELEEQILVNLPVKSLLRFRSVCKSWKSLITDPKFENDHLRANNYKSNTSFSNSNASSSSLVFRFSDPSLLYDFDLGQNNRALSQLNLEETNRFRLIPGHGLRNRYNILGYHCNGIVCLVDLSNDREQRVAFYNPALRQDKLVPNPVRFSGFGFGYDHKTEDYKFIGIEFNPLLGLSEYKAEVYTLRTGQWREVKAEMNCSLISTSGAYVKGRYYWVDYIGKSIVFFDMCEESFGRVDLPRCQARMGFDEWFEKNPSVIARGADSLAYVVTSSDGVWNDTFEIWVMDGGDRGGWARHFKVGPLASLVRPVAFWKDDEMLMEDRDWRIFSYNLSTEELTKVRNPGAVKRRTIFKSLYVESLVSVKPKKNYNHS